VTPKLRAGLEGERHSPFGIKSASKLKFFLSTSTTVSLHPLSDSKYTIVLHIRGQFWLLTFWCATEGILLLYIKSHLPTHYFSFPPRLNFYGFLKLRSESDLQTHTQALRFSHEFFQKGRPDLLHLITRSTAQKPTADAFHEGDVEAMQQKIDMLERKVESVEEAMDHKLRQVTLSLTEGYMSRICALEASHERLLQGITQLIPSMAFPMTSSHLTSMPISSALAAAAVSRNPMASWPTTGKTSPPILRHLDSNLVSAFVRSKNQSHLDAVR
jgi:hypothetical protein